MDRYRTIQIKDSQIRKAKAMNPDLSNAAAINAAIDAQRGPTMKELVCKMNLMKRLACFVGLDVLVKQIQSGAIKTEELAAARAEILEDGSVAMYFAPDHDTGEFTKYLLIPYSMFQDNGEINANLAEVRPVMH